MIKLKESYRTFAVLFLVSAGFFLFLAFLYQYNNKYTADSPQPIAGLFSLSEDELQERDIFYLIDGWQFYPDQLITPSALSSGESAGFMQTVSIGKYNDFSMGKDRSPDGSATYRLTLSLPDTPHTYALYLQEIFSAYRLYIDDSLIASMGNPDPGNYQDSVQNRMITFTASGNTDLMIQVTNHSHFYSGMTYPPAFGLSDSIELLLDTQLLICMAVLTTIFLCAVLAFYFSIINTDIRRRTLLYFLTCAALFCCTSYRIIFTYFALKPGAWYPFEIFCIYSIYLLAVLLQSDICETYGKKLLFICIPLALFCIMSVLYGITDGHTQLMNTIFQISSRIVKFLTVIWLLYHAVTSLLYKKTSSLILLSGTAVFAISVFADRIFPLYEPVYGGWFSEWGTFFLLLCYGIIICKDLAFSYKLRFVFQEEKRQLNKQLAMQQVHYQELTEKIEDSIRYRHDERHRLNTLSSLLEKGDLAETKKFLREYQNFSIARPQTALSLHLTVDAILQFYKQLSSQSDIRFSTEIDLPAELPVSDVDLSILFSNLIENAYEACISQDPPEPYIYVTSRYRQNTLLLRIENSIFQKPLMHDGKFRSTKHSGYGTGTQSAAAVVRQYNGQLKYDITDKTFRVSVILNI